MKVSLQTISASLQAQSRSSLHQDVSGSTKTEINSLLACVQVGTVGALCVGSTQELSSTIQVATHMIQYLRDNVTSFTWQDYSHQYIILASNLAPLSSPLVSLEVQLVTAEATK